MTRTLTKRQEQIFFFVQDEIQEKRRSPTLMEIAKEFGIRNPNGVRNHILSLEKKGWIKRDSDKARSITIVRAPGRFSRIVAAMKKKIWAKRKCMVYLPVYFVLHTRRNYPFFEADYGQKLEIKLRKLAANHDWDVLEIDIQPDRMRIGLSISPDHSIERVIRNIKNTTLSMRMKHPFHFGGKSVWASGYAVSSDPSVLEDLACQHRETVSQEKNIKEGK